LDYTEYKGNKLFRNVWNYLLNHKKTYWREKFSFLKKNWWKMAVTHWVFLSLTLDLKQ